MEQRVTALYFSPTHGTRAYVRAVAAAIPGEHREVDLTRPEERRKEYHFTENDLVILGVPVYYGRVPEVEGLLDGVADTPEKRERYLRIIRGKTEEIDDMVRKLFLFSKLDMGEYPYSPERLDAAQEISDFVSASADDYLRRGLRIRPGPLPEGACIDADPTCLRSVLTNLLDNSAKYRSKPTGTAVITAEARGGRLILRVDDDGPGVPEEALPKPFDVFYRSDPSRQNPKQGSGLGLAIAAKAAGRMGGTIRAANLCGGGLSVELEIPLVKEEET